MVRLRAPLPGIFTLLALASACDEASRVAPAPSGAPVASASPADVAPARVDPDDPSACAPCHGAIVQEWRESQHARAHHGSDPVYGALRALRTEKQGAHVPGQCASCHNPRDLSDHESGPARTGVGCATCHQLDGVRLGEGRQGAAALTPATDVRFRGPHDVADGTSPVHGNGPRLAELADGSTLCLACHGEVQNPAGVTTCATGVEHVGAPGGKPCTACHMAEVPTPAGAASTRATHRSHDFRGPQHALRTGRRELLAEGVHLSGSFAGKQLEVRLENRSGHAFPTGFPGRAAVLEIRGLDAAGAEVFRNVRQDPMAEHSDAVFNRGFVGADGKPTLAAFATKQVRDNRLRPGEVRTVSIELPDAVVVAALRMRFSLVPGPLAKTLAYDGPETKPIVLEPVLVKR